MFGETEFVGGSHLNVPHTKAPYKKPWVKRQHSFHFASTVLGGQVQRALSAAETLDERLEKSKAHLCILKFKRSPQGKG